MAKLTRLQRLSGRSLIGAIFILGLGACTTETKTDPQTAQSNPAAQPSIIATAPDRPQSAPDRATLPVPAMPPLASDKSASNSTAAPLAGLIPATSADARATQAQKTVTQRDPFTSTKPTILSVATKRPDQGRSNQSTTAAKTPKRPTQKIAVKPAQSNRKTTRRSTPPVKVVQLNSLKPTQAGQAKAAAKQTTPKIARLPQSLPSLPKLPTSQPLRQPQKVTPPAPKTAVKPKPQTVNAPIVTPPAPVAPPRPTLAEAVAIMGVVQTGGRTMVIAQAPNESGARYVAAGGSLSGGKVRVKNVQIIPGSEPIVILEENGMEVTKSVGR